MQIAKIRKPRLQYYFIHTEVPGCRIEELLRSLVVPLLISKNSEKHVDFMQRLKLETAPEISKLGNILVSLIFENMFEVAQFYKRHDIIKLKKLHWTFLRSTKYLGNIFSDYPQIPSREESWWNSQNNFLGTIGDNGKASQKSFIEKLSRKVSWADHSCHPRVGLMQGWESKWVGFL